MYNLKGKSVLVVGLGKSGQSACKFLIDEGAKVFATDQKNRNELNEVMKNLDGLKIEFDLGTNHSKYFGEVELIILSPGVPHTIEGLAEARAKNIPVINDIELASAYIKCPIIAVTGTNGKTTTTTLISEMLKNDGKKVFTGGNIGTPILNMILNKETPDVVVLEVSSFQCESLNHFKPTVAVFTNLEPNHQDRYPQGLETYYEAKKRLIKNASAETVLVTNLENSPATQIGKNFPGKIFYFTKKNPMTINPSFTEGFHGAYLQKPKVIYKNGSDEEFLLTSFKVPGDHNKENVMAAICAVKNLNCSKLAIQKTIDAFKGVAHRLEFVRKKDGVYFYNDSKSTSVPSLKRALSSFMAPVILISGGRDKDQDFSPLVELVHGKVKNLILLGEAKEKLNRAIGDYSETFLVGTFEEAILIAYQKSRNGDVILLSPGCASYDMFKNYEERGEYFKKLVAQL